MRYKVAVFQDHIKIKEIDWLESNKQHSIDTLSNFIVSYIDYLANDKIYIQKHKAQSILELAMFLNAFLEKYKDYKFEIIEEEWQCDY